MNRIAIFAHYDRDGVIDDYVLYYLRGLRTVANRILFVSDSALRDGEAAKLDDLATPIAAAPHGEHDFGSWKRGLASLGSDFGGCDELILANDSCYAPAFSLTDVFDRMADAPFDAWSATATLNKGTLDYLNSYFLVLRAPVLRDRDFAAFWREIGPQPAAADVVARYEKGLSHLLMAKGYRLGSVVPPDPLVLPLHGIYVRRLMAAYRSPWLKVRLFRDNPFRVVRLGEALAALDTVYPRSLIDAHTKRTIGTDDPPHYHFRLGSFRLRWRDGRALQLSGRIRADRWWKLYVEVFGVPIGALVLPLRSRRRS